MFGFFFQNLNPSLEPVVKEVKIKYIHTFFMSLKWFFFWFFFNPVKALIRNSCLNSWALTCNSIFRMMHILVREFILWLPLKICVDLQFSRRLYGRCVFLQNFLFAGPDVRAMKLAVFFVSPFSVFLYRPRPEWGELCSGSGQIWQQLH